MAVDLERSILLFKEQFETKFKDKCIKLFTKSDQSNQQLDKFTQGLSGKELVQKKYDMINQIREELISRIISPLISSLETVLYRELDGIEGYIHQRFLDQLCEKMVLDTNGTLTFTFPSIEKWVFNNFNYLLNIKLKADVLAPVFDEEAFQEGVKSIIRDEMKTFNPPKERVDLKDHVFLRRLDVLCMLLAGEGDTACVAMAYSPTEGRFVIGFNADTEVRERLISEGIQIRLSMLAHWLKEIPPLIKDSKEDKNLTGKDVSNVSRVKDIAECITDEAYQRFVGNRGFSLDSFVTSVRSTPPSSMEIKEQIKKKIAKIIDVFAFRKQTYEHYPNLVDSLNPFANVAFVLPSACKRRLFPQSSDAQLTQPISANAQLSLGSYHAEQLIMEYFVNNKDLAKPRELGISKLMCHTCYIAHGLCFSDVFVSGISQVTFQNVLNIFIKTALPLKGSPAKGIMIREASDPISDVEGEHEAKRSALLHRYSDPALDKSLKEPQSPIRQRLFYRLFSDKVQSKAAAAIAGQEAPVAQVGP